MSSGHPETRRRILESAWALLEASHGCEVRMSDIARDAGVSRQAVYLHFPTRADLLVATTRYIDEVKDVDARLVPSRTAKTGVARLETFIRAWGDYIPEIYGVGCALMAMGDTDDAAKTAWDGRMDALRQGCRAAVDAIDRDGRLCPDLSAEIATDLLWTLLSVRNWEHLTRDCGWPRDLYVARITALARKALLSDPAQTGDP